MCILETPMLLMWKINYFFFSIYYQCNHFMKLRTLFIIHCNVCICCFLHPYLFLWKSVNQNHHDSGAVLGIFIRVALASQRAKQILDRPTGVVYAGQNFVWVGQARVWVGHVLPGLIARTASAMIHSITVWECIVIISQPNTWATWVWRQSVRQAVTPLCGMIACTRPTVRPSS